MSLFRGIAARKDATRGTSPIEVRKVLAGLFASTSGIGARSGIIYNGATVVLVAGSAGWVYWINTFHAVASRGSSDGVQVYGNDAPVNIGATGVGSTIPIAPGAGLSRIDIIWTRHPTNLENADTSSEPLFGVASGTAASSAPVAPTIPAGALELGRNLMTSAATSTLSAGNTITQSALYTALRGAPVPVHNATERAAAFPSPDDGDQVYRLDTHQVEVYDGTRWGDGTFVPLVVGYTAADYAGVATAATVTFTAENGRTYRINAGLIGIQVTATGVPTVKLLVDTVEQFRLATTVSCAPSTTVWGTPVQYILVGDGASHTVAVTAQAAGGGALRIAASGVNQLVVEQIA